MLNIEKENGLVTISVVGPKGKNLQVPYQVCTLEEYHSPSEMSTKYWAHYGFNPFGDENDSYCC